MTIKHLYPNSRPTLDLKFAQDKKLDPRITFSRNSIGTYVDENGVIQSAASGEARFDHDPVTGESLGLLVEESRTNAITYSNDLSGFDKFDNIVIPNYPSPDGGATAVSYTEVSGGQIGLRFAITGSGNKVFSIFAKSGSSSTLYMRIWDGSYGGAAFDLSNGTILSTDSGWTSFAPVNMGNGWYRCSIRRNVVNTANPECWVFTLSGQLLLWGAQAEAGTFPTSYIPTPATFTSRSTTATYYDANGVIQTAAIDVARDNAYFPDENGVMRPAGLLLEGSVTNLITQSNSLSSFSYTGHTLSTNVTTSPDGTTNASSVTSGGTGTAYKFTTTSNPSTFSMYCKANSVGWVKTNVTGSGDSWFNLQTGEKGAGVGSIQALPGGWNRISVYTTSTGSIQTQFFPTIADGSFDRTSGNSIFVWGAQLEESPYASSYIPTDGTLGGISRAADVSTSPIGGVTRVADVASITGSNFSSWYNQSEGTVLVSQRNDPADSTGTVLEIGGTTGNYALGHTAHNIGFANSTTLDTRSYFIIGGIPSAFFYGSRTSPGTIAYAYKEGNYGLSTGGSSVPINAGGWNQLVPVVDSSLGLGRRRDGSSTTQLHISRLTYYPTRLSDTLLQTLTT